jgi:hypothetical protein
MTGPVILGLPPLLKTYRGLVDESLDESAHRC